MKSEAALSSEAFTSFLQMHPELSLSGMDSLTSHIANKEKIYARLGIDHAIKHMYEDILIEQGIRQSVKNNNDFTKPKR